MINSMNTDEIKKQLKAELTDFRYKHTIGVAYTAMALAMRYEASIKDAEIAGLLHDCAKCMTDNELLTICSDYNIYLSEEEVINTSLLHAKAGAVIAKNDYDIEDEGILDAIRFHTTGRPDMTMLEKIIFTADYIEPGRTRQPRLSEVRKMAFIDIDACVHIISSDTLVYLNNINNTIDILTEETCKYYKESYENWRKANG